MLGSYTDLGDSTLREIIKGQDSITKNFNRLVARLTGFLLHCANIRGLFALRSRFVRWALRKIVPQPGEGSPKEDFVNRSLKFKLSRLQTANQKGTLRPRPNTLDPHTT